MSRLRLPHSSGPDRRLPIPYPPARAARLVAVAAAAVLAACTGGGAPGPAATGPPGSPGSPTAAGPPGTASPPPAADCRDSAALPSAWARRAERLAAAGVPELPGYRLDPMDNAESRGAITERGLPVWSCQTGIDDPRVVVRWVETERTQVGWLMVLPLPERLPADVAAGALPAALRGFADAGAGTQVDREQVGGTRLYTVDVATTGVDADLAGWVSESVAVVVFLLQPRNAADTARGVLGGRTAAPTGTPTAG